MLRVVINPPGKINSQKISENAAAQTKTISHDNGLFLFVNNNGNLVVIVGLHVFIRGVLFAERIGAIPAHAHIGKANYLEIIEEI